MALSAGKWAALCCTQNRQTRPPRCRQLWAPAGTGGTKQNLAPHGQLTPERVERKVLGYRPHVAYPRLASELGHSVGRACEEEASGLWSLDSVASGDSLGVGKKLSSRRVRLKERKRGGGGETERESMQTAIV